jgi:GDP/UDP-N,N'-diacetylbacillosamine 2-epimerase (hydrolysing)
MKKVCVVTGTRAEYGLLYWSIKGITESSKLELQLCVTGMHLSPEFGLTYKQIEKDGIEINEKIEILLSSDTPIGISKSIGLGIISFSEVFARLKPDVLLLLGDRFEIFAAVIAAMIAKIPVAHCHGGEATEGSIDESIRHSITKMSHIHFTATEEYKRRVIQLGEHPKNVYNVGALGIENINKLTLLDRMAFEASIGFKLSKINFLVTYHPVTLESDTAKIQFLALLNALDEYSEANVIFTKPNSDTDGRVIIQMIDDYVSRHQLRCISFISLGQLRYLSALQYIDLVIGNSSSGLVEVPTFKKATINIGDRQKGRIRAKSVIDCSADSISITKAIQLGLSIEFQDLIAKQSNPYGISNSSNEIINILENVELEGILKKEFYNI